MGELDSIDLAIDYEYVKDQNEDRDSSILELLQERTIVLTFGKDKYLVKSFPNGWIC